MDMWKLCRKAGHNKNKLIDSIKHRTRYLHTQIQAIYLYLQNAPEDTVKMPVNGSLPPAHKTKLSSFPQKSHNPMYYYC